MEFPWNEGKLDPVLLPLLYLIYVIYAICYDNDIDLSSIMTNEVRICQNCKTEFTIEPEDFDYYKKMSVPPPTFLLLAFPVSRASPAS